MAELIKYSIESSSGCKAELTNYGARLMSLFIPGKTGDLVNVCLGFKTPEEYFLSDEKYFGAIVGRYCNRIAQGRFKLDGITYQLATNNGPNHLHGGIDAFHNTIWAAKVLSKNAIEFRQNFQDGEEGYPGKLDVRLIYALVDNELHISVEAKSDKRTILNITSHPYFNLKGEGAGSVLDHLLMMNANSFTPVDENVIPTGEIESVENTPFDFSTYRKIGERIDQENEQLEIGNGYDHNFVLDQKIPEVLGLAASVIEPETGLKMEVHTSEPGLQFYTANWLSGKDQGYSGRSYKSREAFCLEPQHFPDSPNKDHFPSTILETGAKYLTKTVFKFFNS